MIVVRTHSNVPIMLPIPNVINIRKNITLHKGFTSIHEIASVNAIKVRPGPWATYKRDNHSMGNKNQHRFQIFKTVGVKLNDLFL